MSCFGLIISYIDILVNKTSKLTILFSHDSRKDLHYFHQNHSFDIYSKFASVIVRIEDKKWRYYFHIQIGQNKIFFINAQLHVLCIFYTTTCQNLD